MEAMTRATDPELVDIVASAAAGDDLAFGRIVTAHHDDMRRVCAFVTRDDALADDAVQIAWSVAWRKLDSLKEPERLRPWLTRIAVNEAKRLLAKQSRRSQVELVAQASRVTGGVDPATGIERIDALAAMDRLKPDDRALIAMRYVMGFDATELSTVIGMSPAATRQRLKRLLDRLREELE
jgi:RNA polymerase sigma-70 factor (ECF subfamily)